GHGILRRLQSDRLRGGALEHPRRSALRPGEPVPGSARVHGAVQGHLLERRQSPGPSMRNRRPGDPARHARQLPAPAPPATRARNTCFYVIITYNDVMGGNNPFVYGEVVTAAAFADREEERARLGRDLAEGQKVFLISPRRYGKSSLIRGVMKALAAKRILTVEVTVAASSRSEEHTS